MASTIRIAFARHSLASATTRHLGPHQTFLQTLDRRRTGSFVYRNWQSTFTGQYPARPTRSFTNRTLRFVLKYGSIAAFSCFAGAYYVLALSPNQDAILALFNQLSRRPTAAETLSAYEPSDPTTAAINTHIVDSPLAISLRTSPHKFTEWRPHLQIPPILRPTNLTGGTLLGPGRIEVPPLMFNDAEGKNMVALFYLGEQLCGHPGIVHGGLLATLLDEGLARCCFPALPNKLGVTASLKIDYRRPAKAEKYYVLRAETTKVEGRKAWVKGWIEEMSEDGGISEPPIKVVEAEALYIEPKNAKMMKRLYTVE